MLARLRGSDKVSLSVGSDEVRLEGEAETIVEKKVALPLRWLKGFVEVQAYQSRMVAVLEVSGIEAHRFLRSLPRAKTRHASWVMSISRGLRLSHVRCAGGVAVSGLERLRILEPLARFANHLRIYAAEEEGASGWELVFGDSRFHLLLSPDVWRGFSGEGQALTSLASEKWKTLVPRIHTLLRWVFGDIISNSSPAVTKATSEARAGRIVCPGIARGLWALIWNQVRTSIASFRSIFRPWKCLATAQGRAETGRRREGENRRTQRRTGRSRSSGQRGRASCADGRRRHSLYVSLVLEASG